MLTRRQDTCLVSRDRGAHKMVIIRRFLFMGLWFSLVSPILSISRRCQRAQMTLMRRRQIRFNSRTLDSTDYCSNRGLIGLTKDGNQTFKASSKLWCVNIYTTCAHPSSIRCSWKTHLLNSTSLFAQIAPLITYHC